MRHALHHLRRGCSRRRDRRPSPPARPQRRADCARPAPQCGSTWQSLARNTGSIETDYLNGEIALLGRLHGVPTPVNAAMQAIAARMASEGAAPGVMSAAEVEAAIGA